MAQEEDAKNIDLSLFRQTTQQIANEIVDLLVAKRGSYGPDNLNKFGEFGIVVRLGDKYERLAYMLKNGIDNTPVDETREDAWKDMIGYSILGLIYARKQQSFSERAKTIGSAIAQGIGRGVLYDQVMGPRERISPPKRYVTTSPLEPQIGDASPEEIAQGEIQ